MNSLHKACLVCNSSNLKSLPKYSHAFLVKCNHCGFVFSQKIPTSEELIEHYRNYPKQSTVSLITVKRYNELLDLFEPFRRNNSILDVGCGDAFFLETAKKRGWDVFGTEFSDEAVANATAKGITMGKGVLDPRNFNITFDIITSFEVIEHINNPLEELSNFYKLLRKGGGLYFTTPNFNSVSKRISAGNWNVIEYPEHLCYYTPKTINYALKKANFKKKWLITSGINLQRVKQSIKKENNLYTDENLRKKTEEKFIYKFYKIAINNFLNLFKIGDTIKGLYIKRND